jgi:nitroreductase
MDVHTAIETRRSIRRYRPDPVPEDRIDAWLRLLMRTPSAADARPWQFVVVDRRDLLDRLEQAMPKCEMLRTAPAAILVVAEPAREKIPGFWPQDCACAAVNLLLAAHADGYGACWIGVHPVADRERACREALGMPESAMPFALIALGRPDETPASDDRYEAGRIHRNGW